MADKTTIMKDAQKYLARGQVDKAISEWEKLLSESPDGNTYNIIGDLYLKKGDRKNAIDSFHKAAGYFRNEGFSLKALALYKKVLNINPSDADALYALGQLSEEKGLVTDATKYYLATADSLSKEGKKDRLLDIYEKILSLSPTNVPLRNRVAEIFLKEGLKSDASREYIYIARIYDEKGDSENAAGYYQKVLGMQPLNKEAVIGLGHLYEKTGEIEKAVAHMKEASTLFHGDADVLLRCAEVLLVGGRDDEARDYLARIIEVEPDNLRARRFLGEIYLKSGARESAWTEFLPVIDEMILNAKYEDALKLLETFREIDPLETGKRLVSLYRQLGDESMVVSELTTMGDTLKDRGMGEEALELYSNALEIRPDDEHLKELVRELRKEPEKEAVTIRISEGEKTLEELFIEADIFSRYGLVNEALRLLEGLKMKEPENIDLHMRLKSLYVDSSDKQSAVTECLVLYELFKRLEETENAEKMLRDAFDIDPEDPRLAEKGFIPAAGLQAAAVPVTPGEPEAPAEELELEDYEDQLAEADFYVRQGLMQEAAVILERLHRLFPENADVNERLESLGQMTEASELPEMPGTIEIPEETFEQGAPLEEIQEEVLQAAGRPEPGKGEYEDASFAEHDLAEAQEMPEPTLDSDVLEIFQEFKKGLEKELGDEDSETHYNLGIAYKEMGLVDDAIKEFQTSRNDPKRFVQSSTMLGICYMEKGLYSLAIDVLTKVIREVSDKDEVYWAIKYDLAEAYEKNSNLKEALDLYTAVYGWNARFRNVSDKISQVRSQLLKGGGGEKPKEKKDRVSYL